MSLISMAHSIVGVFSISRSASLNQKHEIRILRIEALQFEILDAIDVVIDDDGDDDDNADDVDDPDFREEIYLDDDDVDDDDSGYQRSDSCCVGATQ